VGGGHDFSLIFVLFVKFLCLTWAQVKQSPHLLPTVTAFDFAAFGQNYGQSALLRPFEGDAI
jgi:hypothetical protein